MGGSEQECFVPQYSDKLGIVLHPRIAIPLAPTSGVFGIHVQVDLGRLSVFSTQLAFDAICGTPADARRVSIRETGRNAIADGVNWRTISTIVCRPDGVREGKGETFTPRTTIA